MPHRPVLIPGNTTALDVSGRGAGIELLLILPL